MSIACSEEVSQISVQGNAGKKIRIEVDGNENKIVFAFD